MNPRLLAWSLKALALTAALFVCAGVWYYAWGRKPQLLISAPVPTNGGPAFVCATGPNELILVTGSKATCYDLQAKKARWSVDVKAPSASSRPIAAASPPAPAPVKAPPTATPPAAWHEEQVDPLLAARVKRSFAKLDKWAGDLNRKRAALKTALQIEAFNVEAAKYHAELSAARAEAAPLHPVAAPLPRPAAALEVDLAEVPRSSRLASSSPRRQEIAALGSAIWIGQGTQLVGLDRADGHVSKSLVLAGNLKQLLHGSQYLYALAQAEGGRKMQITRVAAADGAVVTVVCAVPPSEPAFTWQPGSPERPSTPPFRTEFSANRADLLQLDVRLLEKKVVERQLTAGKGASDMEDADRKTTGGWGADAAVFAKAMASDAEREAQGGRELLDESTYEVCLTRPFQTGLQPAKATVHGRPEVLSTASLNLIIAGREMLAFDPANRKLWQTQLAQPARSRGRDVTDSQGEAATESQPCLEAGDRLYFFDRTFLTAFQRDTGQAAWRMPIQETHKLQIDSTGALYLSAGGGNQAMPRLMKIESATGKILWTVEKYDDCFVSGAAVYATREVRNPEDAVNAVFDRSKAVACRWKLYKLSARDGEAQWEWFQSRRPVRVEPDQRKVTLLFANEMQVLTSLSF